MTGGPVPQRSDDPDRDEADADPVEIAREIALRRLEQRDYSRGELSEYLVRRRGCDQGVADELLDRLEAVGLVDDRRFALAWAQSRRRSRKLSLSAIARELQAKRVSAEIIAETLSASDQDGEAETALALARSKARAMRGLDRPIAYRRLAAALARRGYAPSVSFDAVDRALAELDD
ncbi:regulatory protein RecX [Propionibacterium australiense]|uniref:Regulatory protein RecX n=1 Tax=Propionibacterium australiense TaxID=119981 RepID=A0A383S5X5_9ACTN|nr:regulatory protein RecX [Propionibacterium australiense]SYZ32834.1 Regulatory protein RecX [Propionibacterium australiense]VEH91151.1 Regulatory protein recX [Propionibacterium australiense]